MSSKEVHADTDQTNRNCHIQYFERCFYIVIIEKNHLEECHNQNHDNDFEDLVLEIVQVVDIKYAPEPALNPCNINFRYEEFIDAETEDQEDETDQVIVHSPDDPYQDIHFVDSTAAMNKIGKNIDDLYRAGKKQDNCGDCTKDYPENYDETHTPERPFEEILNNTLIGKSFYALCRRFCCVWFFHT